VSDPLGHLPLAIAARGGHVDRFEVQQLVAAGLTLLQRSAPLVSALHKRRAALLLPTSPAFITALAASEGRSAVLRMRCENDIVVHVDGDVTVAGVQAWCDAALSVYKRPSRVTVTGIA
jgi:hypothetical protein